MQQPFDPDLPRDENAGSAALLLVADHLPALISWVGADARYRFVNRAYTEFFGHSREDIEGRHMRDVVGEQAWELIRPWVEQVLRGEPVEYEARLPYQFGGARDVLARYVPHRDEQGRVDSFFVLVNDISERKRYESQLRHAERRVATVLDSLPEGYYEVDYEARFVYMNAEAERYFGITRHAVIGREISEVFPASSGTIFEEALRTALVGRRPATIESSGVVHTDRVVELRAYPTEGGAAVFFREVTERKKLEAALRETEERFQTMADSTPLILWVGDLHGRLTFVNRAYCEFFGRSRDELLGTAWQSLIHEDDLERYMREVGRSAEEMETFRSEARLRHPDGTWHWVESYAEPRFSASGEFLGYVGSSRDVTDRKLEELHQQFLARLDATLMHLRQPGEIVEAVLRDLAAHVCSELTGYAEVSADGSRAIVEHAVGQRGAMMLGTYRLTDYFSDELRADFVDGRAVVVCDATRDPRTRALLENLRGIGIESFVIVPLLSSGQLKAALCVDAALPRHWREDEARVIREAATRLFAAVERARAEEHVRASEHRLQSALETARVCAFEWNCTSDRVVRTENAREILGWEVDATTDRGDAYFSRVHEDDRELFRELVRCLTPASPDYQFVYRYLRPDGAGFTWLEETGRGVFDAAGKLSAVRGLTADVSQRVRASEALTRSEARFRHLASAMPQAVWIANSKGEVTYCNDRTAAFGWALSGERDARDWDRIVHPEELAATREAWARAAERMEPYEYEHRLRMGDGSWRWHLSRAVPVGDPSIGSVEWFGTATDVHTAREAREALIVADRRKDEFLAVLSHELRTPLTAAYGWTRILRDGLAPDEETRKAALEAIDTSLQAQARMIDELLEVSRITTGKVVLNAEPLDLRAVIQDAVL